MRALITSLIAGAVVLGGAGVVISHHSADANTTAAYTSQKQQRINQGLAQAQKNTAKAHDHGGVANFPSPSPHAIADPALPIGPTPMTQSSAWIAGWYPQTFNEVLVLGGSDQSKPNQGILDVQVLNQPGASWNGEFLAPGITGAITITSIKGPVVQWTSTSGATGSFNLTTQKWGAS